MNAGFHGTTLNPPLEGMAKQTLLPIPEVGMWLDHLKTVDENMKCGTAKVAATRRRKQQYNSLRASKQILTTTMWHAIWKFG